MLQNHMLMAESTWYYSFRYSTICYGISGFLCACYNFSPVNLQILCDECGAEFGVMFVLGYSIGGLVIACHKKIRDELIYLS